MLTYWIMFVLLALAALAARPALARTSFGAPTTRLDGVWVFVILVLVIIIGFRSQVGGDWFNYIRHFNEMSDKTWAFAFSKSEFSHWAVNKLMAYLGWGVTGVNVLYASVFAVGLVTFARAQHRPWIVMAVSVPYLIIVVGMGYSRQAVALGFALLGLVALARGRFLVFSLWVLVGATFHNSAVLLIPLAGLATERNRLQALAGVAFITWVGYDSLLSDRFDTLVDVYVTRQLTDSQGALIRLSMNALAGALFLNYRKAFEITLGERRLWSIVALVTLAMWVGYFVTGLSTALDRMALYLIPLQLVVASHLPSTFGRRGGQNTGATFVILCYFGLVQFVWLNFASHSTYWIPYQMGITD